ncbi:MAG: hypothetical protein QM682_18075 [Paracoccus sp. (in: a-proteobacteria)]|uniref:hypothetical protein n=1 Tax=Paracoccus sp. TaxID=267 RepID=UPI0039E3B874
MMSWLPIWIGVFWSSAPQADQSAAGALLSAGTGAAAVCVAGITFLGEKALKADAAMPGRQRRRQGPAQPPRARQQRQRHHQRADGHGEKPADQGPELKPHLPQRPDAGAEEGQAEQCRAACPAPDQVEARKDRHQARDQEIPASAARDQPAPADGEEQARRQDDQTQKDQPCAAQAAWSCVGASHSNARFHGCGAV